MVLLVVLAAGVIAPVQQRDAVATARFEARAVALVAMGATPADLCGGGGASGPGCLVCTCCCATAAALPVVPARQPRIGWLLSGAVCNLCEKGGPARRIFDPGTPLRGPPALA